nr:MAG TPA: hypothetical protein [Caudoviricetes sp.]
MKHIKSYLIHLLGGITKQEHDRLSMDNSTLRDLARLHNIKQKADSLYGTPPEEWCRKVYKYITDEIDNMENSVHEEEKGGNK